MRWCGRLRHRPHFYFTIKDVWRAGDLLMWDNRTLHAHTYFSADGRRLLGRVAILGEKPA